VVRDAAGNAFAGIGSGSGWNFSVAAAAVDDHPYSTSTTGTVSINGPATPGTIEVGGDRDLFRVQLTAGVAYSFSLERTAGGLSDPYLTLWNAELVAGRRGRRQRRRRQFARGLHPGGRRHLLPGCVRLPGHRHRRLHLRGSTRDTQAPTLVTRTPADDGTGVAVDADLLLTFSEPVLAGSGLIRLLECQRRGAARDPRRRQRRGAHQRQHGHRRPGAQPARGIGLLGDHRQRRLRDAAGNAYAGIGALTEWNFSTVAVSANDDFPLSVDTPAVLTVNGSARSGSIDYVDDGDLFRVSLTAGVTYRFDMVSPSTSSVDPYLMLFG
jgi:hypothetical protein